MSNNSRINVVLVSSAKYNLEYFTEIVFFSKSCRAWSDLPCPAYAQRGKTLEIDREFYEKRNLVSSSETKKRFTLFKTSKIIEIPIMVIGTSSLTFTDDYFRKYTIQKMIEADVMVMFYDKTQSGVRGLHDLIGIYSSYLKERENEQKQEGNNSDSKRKQPCLLIELIKPASDYELPDNGDVNIADQIGSFSDLILNDSNFYHISLEVSSIPPDIYRVIESMILDVV